MFHILLKLDTQARRLRLPGLVPTEIDLLSGAFDNDSVMMPVMAFFDDQLRGVMMPLAVIIEGDRAVATVMETMPILNDNGCAMVMMPVMRLDHICLGSGCDSRSGDAERQSGEKHCFHCD
ncbi:hypothetical protein [Mesorhizobium sp. RIZ17]|uniref:hypothetical protein n=1 Tax=Mesorhizobium sp. RIZ17 TaxID=3132743 RepID=UPI003DA9609F